MKLCYQFNKAFWGFEFTLDKNYIIATTLGAVFIYNPSDYTEYANLKGIMNIGSIDYNVRSGLLLVRSIRGFIIIYDIKEKQLRGKIKYSEKGSQDCNAVFTADGMNILCCSSDMLATHINNINLKSMEISDIFLLQNKLIIRIKRNMFLDEYMFIAMDNEDIKYSIYSIFNTNNPTASMKCIKPESDFEEEWDRFDYNPIKKQYAIITKGKNRFDSELLLADMELHRISRNVKVGTFPLNATRVEWSSSGKFILVTCRNGLAIYDGAELKCLYNEIVPGFATATFANTDHLLCISTERKTYVYEMDL